MNQYHAGPEALFGVGALILGLVIAWAIMRNRHRNRANDPVTDAAVREQYDKPNSYDPDNFRADLKPKG